ncbi:hypothetical protein Q1695_008612 [Nippostrongylus brasiliensis]|nr:hypothetical protein Q1695_008612 [Nippostrongylus brasiliensis]
MSQNVFVDDHSHDNEQRTEELPTPPTIKAIGNSHRRLLLTWTLKPGDEFDSRLAHIDDDWWFCDSGRLETVGGRPGIGGKPAT